MFAIDTFELLQKSKHGDGLERLAQPHLVCQDAANARVVQPDHPIQPLDLILAHCAKLNVGRLNGQVV